MADDYIVVTEEDSGGTEKFDTPKTSVDDDIQESMSWEKVVS